MEYAGTYIGTIKAKHVGWSFFKVFENKGFMLGSGFGFVCLCDIGKRVYLQNKRPVIENNDQRDKRLMAEGY